MDQGWSRKEKRYGPFYLISLLGGGRKIRDPEMEKKLYAWYNQLKIEGIPVTPKMIKQKALDITKFKDFIASKGWLEKFKRKFNLELSRENKDSCSTVNSTPSFSISTIVTPTFNIEQR